MSFEVENRTLPNLWFLIWASSHLNPTTTELNVRFDGNHKFLFSYTCFLTEV